MNIEKDKVLLIYDKQCPACEYYCHLVRIKDSIGELVLIDAREDTEVMAEISGLGLDIDQGMVLKFNNHYYYGADAIHMLSLLGSQSTVLNRINYVIFRSKWRSAMLYPILKFCRNMLLKVLGKNKINNLDIENNTKF